MPCSLSRKAQTDGSPSWGFLPIQFCGKKLKELLTEHAAGVGGCLRQERCFELVRNRVVRERAPELAKRGGPDLKNSEKYVARPNGDLSLERFGVVRDGPHPQNKGEAVKEVLIGNIGKHATCQAALYVGVLVAAHPAIRRHLHSSDTFRRFLRDRLLRKIEKFRLKEPTTASAPVPEKCPLRKSGASLPVPAAPFPMITG